ncbi:MAG: carboxylesterase/lipase family protein [Rhodospirillales bacterium]|nr:carboxylesterase/lipase family protein [Rhodospirillales bacterium]
MIFQRSLPSCALLLGALLLAGQSAATPSNTVSIETGPIAGAAADAITVFRGIPYAAPPVGALRWRSPQPPQPWTEMRDATRFGPSCPQAAPEGVSDITHAGGAPEPTSEDCLTLNVWAPAHASGRAAVMVWFHGGSGVMGSGSLPFYDGAAFARDGVVLVTVNYRLGHLGSFTHPALTREAASDEPFGNYALMDQVAALRWVGRNIAAFGGDPGNVTIFGESSGGISVLGLLSTPSAWPLFQKAIVESAGGWFPPSPDLKTTEELGKQVAIEAGAPADATSAQLRALPMRAVVAAHVPVSGYVDRRLMPRDPTMAIRAGQHAAVPLLIGMNSGEDSLIGPAKIAQAQAQITPEQMQELHKLYPGADDELVTRYNVRDGLVAAPARWIAGRWTQRAPAYLYRFDYVNEAGRTPDMRARHGGEVTYVFETLGSEPFDPAPPAPTDADRRMAREVHARWVAFAKSGNPDVPGVATWPSYSRAIDPWMVFGPGGSSLQIEFLKAQLDWQERRVERLLFLLWMKTELFRVFGS